MSGVYGTVRPGNINIQNDVEILYHYRPTRSSESEDFSTFKELDKTCLVKAEDSDNNTILGMYTLKLPVDKFNMKGFYTIYIRPKEIITEIYDVSVLAAYPSVRGIVFELSKLNGITDLTGYRVEYFSGDERNENVKLITSSNRCEVVRVSVNDSYPKTTRYKLTDSSSNIIFCTVTPSTSSSYNPNAAPYIGKTSEKVAIINTKFNPIMLELEMVEHDEETLSYMLEGDQVRDRDKGIITTYNSNHDIYKQHDVYTIKNSLGNPLYDVKEKRDVIDGSLSFENTIKND